MTVRHTRWQGWPAVELRDHALKVVVLPHRGAKIVSLRSLLSDREWLWQDPSRPIRPAALGDDYASHDISGFDECFPTIGACLHPEDPARRLVDHGEVWSRPWRAELLPDRLCTEIDGYALPYILRRSISLPHPGTIRLSYELRNTGSIRFAWLWSAHPLLAAEPGMRIELPGQPALTKEFGLSGRLGPDDASGLRGHHDRYQWPLAESAQGTPTDLRLLDFPAPPVTDKVVARGLHRGEVTLAVPGAAERLTLRYDSQKLPFLGICVNMGAWPSTGLPGRWVALEPSTGGTDRLDEAHARGECAWLEPQAHARWTLDIIINTGAVAA